MLMVTMTAMKRVMTRVVVVRRRRRRRKRRRVIAIAMIGMHMTMPLWSRNGCAHSS
jgi:hypothetical protein